MASSSSSSSSASFVLRHLSISLSLLLLLALALAPCTLAKPISESPYTTYGQCFRLRAPQDLLVHPLVVMGDARPSLTDDALSTLFTGLSRDFALRLCRNAALQDSDEDLLSPSQSSKTERMLPLELFDCDILSGDFAVGVSRDYERNKEPVHALYFKDPVEATLENYFQILKQPSHPKYGKLSSMTLHEAILEAAALGDNERQGAALSFNAMTWRLCGYDCHPANMTLTSALERATRNLNTRVSAVLTENSLLWLDLLQHTVHDNAAIASARRKAKLATSLTSAEQSILEHCNFADRILFSIAQGREALQRKCLRTTEKLPQERRIRI